MPTKIYWYFQPQKSSIVISDYWSGRNIYSFAVICTNSGWNMCKNKNQDYRNISLLKQKIVTISQLKYYCQQKEMVVLYYFMRVSFSDGHKTPTHNIMIKQRKYDMAVNLSEFCLILTIGHRNLMIIKIWFKT